MSGNEPLIVPRFDLAGVDPANRVKVFDDALHEHFYEYEAEYPSGLETGRFEGVVAGALRTASITTDPMSVDRAAPHIAKDGRDAYYLLLPQGGNIRLRQRGSEATVRAGQFAFVSTAEPYSYRQGQTESFHTLVIPGSALRARKPDADDHAGRHFGGSALQRIFVDFCTSFCGHAADLDGDTLRRTKDSLLDMMALVLERADDAPDESAVRLAHRRRILNLIESRFRDPGFGLDQIAQALGLSPRYVQYVLAANGETVSDLLRRRRLVEARCLLDRRDASRASVASIAYAVGYTDPAYFSRVFRRVTGLSPSEYASRSPPHLPSSIASPNVIVPAAPPIGGHRRE